MDHLTFKQNVHHVDYVTQALILDEPLIDMIREGTNETKICLLSALLVI